MSCKSRNRASYGYGRPTGVFAEQSPSSAWKMLGDCFLPRPIAAQVKWSDAFDAVQMEKDEKPIIFFSHVDKIVGILTSLGVQGTVSDVNRKLLRINTVRAITKPNSALYCAAMKSDEQRLRTLYGKDA